MVTTAVTDLGKTLGDGTFVGSWKLDAARSSVSFRTRSMWGLVSVKGVFKDVSGEGTVSADGAVAGTLRIATSSVDTKQQKRDTHLRSADFFDSSKQPEIVFRAERLNLGPQGSTIVGNLEVRGVKRSLTVPVKVSRLDGGAVSLETAIRVNRHDFGITWNQM